MDSGKSIAIRLAQDGYDVCINDLALNQAGIDEVFILLFLTSILTSSSTKEFMH